MSLREILAGEDEHYLVCFIEERLRLADTNTPIAWAWRSVVSFRTMIHMDGLWHAYGNYYEHGELKLLREGLEMLGCSEVLDRIESGSGHMEHLVAMVDEKVSDRVLIDFVRRNESAF